MRTPISLLATCLGLFMVAMDSTAQTLPVPSLPPPAEAPEFEPDSWEYELAVGIAWDSNINFLVPDGPSSTVVIPRGAIARRVSGPRGELLASATASWAGYLNENVQGRSYADAGLRGEYRPTTRTTIGGDARYWLGYSDASPTLIEQGVPLPLLKTQTLNALLDLTQQFSPRSSLRLEGRAYRTDFQDSEAVDGTSLRATVALERSLGERHSAALAYALEQVSSEGSAGAYLTHTGSVQWTRNLTARSGLLVEAGASYTPNAQQAGLGRSEGFHGGVTFARQIGRSNLTAYIRREVTPAFGVGISRQETRAGLQADVPMGKDWQLGLAVYRTQPKAPSESEAILYSSYTDASSRISRRIGRWFVISAEARYRRRGETTSSPAVSAFQAGLFLALENRTR